MFLKRTGIVVTAALLAATLSSGLAWAKGKPGGGGGTTTTVDHKARQARPIQLGTSGGNVTDLANGYCCSGTLGALVQDASGTQYILSNTHVFAGDSVAGGNGAVSSAGNPINQPGFVDVRCQNIAGDYVASLSDWIVLTPGGTSLADAAIAQVLPGAVDPSGSILEIGTLSTQTAPAVLNMAVKKSGRTSGLTKGSVAAINADVTVSYSLECAGGNFTSRYTGQVIVSPGKFLQSGDSGSLLVENVATNPRAVGLLYAGSRLYGIANPIDDVLAVFGVSMVGVDTAAAGASGSTSTSPNVKGASAAKAKAAQRLLSVPGAQGHAVGLADNGSGRVVIKLLVNQITPEAVKAAPQSIDGYSVELMPVGEFVAY